MIGRKTKSYCSLALRIYSSTTHCQLPLSFSFLCKLVVFFLLCSPVDSTTTAGDQQQHHYQVEETMHGVFVFFPAISLILFHAAGPSTSIAAVATHHHNRRVLHQPLFPVASPAPTPPPYNNSTRHPPPSPSAHPLSSTPATGDVTPTAPSTDTNPQNPFFPSYPAPPPPPDTSGTAAALPTFPANISSLVVPGGRTPSSNSSSSSKLIAVAVVLCIVAASLIASFAFLHHRRHRLHHHHHPSFKPPPLLPEQPSHPDDVPLSPTSDDGPPKLLPRPGVSTTSSEFLYLGTISCSDSREFEPNHTTRIDSPEIRPLPPLPSLPKPTHIRVSDSDVTDDEEFYSPTISSGRIESFKSSSSRRGSEALGRIEGLQPGTSNFPDSSSSSPANSAHSEPSVLLNSGTVSSSSCSPEYIIRPPPIIHRTQPPPPLPSPPPPSSTGRRTLSEPPILPQPTRSLVGFKSGEQVQPESWSHDGNQRNDEGRKPKLKGLHWDKVRPNSDRVTVWGQLDHRSFSLNERMRENASTLEAKDLSRRPTNMNQEYRVLDPSKSQNIAILLRSLNVSVEEVCDSLLEGNADMLGTELLESLLRMIPTDEGEGKLKSYEEDDSGLKLGPAEKLLKALLRIPFAFKRIDAMLYMANFDSEVHHLHRSFQTLELASEELRGSRMFLKLLEAVLEAGNQGDPQAFKLDTLLKLVDIKGKDGKTTLLHPVVLEVMKAEGSRLFIPQAVTFHSEMENKRRGLQVIAGLCGELTNVKKAAAMNSDTIAIDLHKLVGGIAKVHDVAKLNEETGSTDESNRARFAGSIREFEKKAHGEIMKVRAEESSSLSKVKELVEYFHGDSVKESAHPLRVFVLVRDFLSVLDQVCKEASKVNDRTMISSARQFVAPLNPALAAPFSDDGNGEKRNGERPLPVEDSGFF